MTRTRQGSASSPRQSAATATDQALWPLGEPDHSGSEQTWTEEQYGKGDASRLLPQLRRHVDRTDVLGYVLARGAYDRSVKNLRKIADKVDFF